MASFTGTNNNDVITGTGDGDAIDFKQGGNDAINAGGGGDYLIAGAALGATDTVDGGVGYDVLDLTGSYAGGLTLTATTLVNVEEIRFGIGFDYAIRTHDNTIAADEVLKIDAYNVLPGHFVIFDASAETDGGILYYDGAGSDVVTGGAQHDHFSFAYGGDDIGHGGAGDDTFFLGDALDIGDVIDGGDGYDVLFLRGDYSIALTLDASNVQSIESISLEQGFGYNLAVTDDVVAAGENLHVSGWGLAAGGYLLFYGAAETDGTFSFIDSINDDAITGGQNDDWFDTYMGGDDMFAGMGGDDRFGMGGELNVGEIIDGGSGSDLLAFAGDYSAGLTLAPNTVTSIEVFTFDQGFDYDITLADGNLAAGETLQVWTNYVSATDAMAFDGSAETDGHFEFYTGASSETLVGGAGNDYFDLAGGGDDVVIGGDGNDTMQFWAMFTSADFVDGGAGHDDVRIASNYVGGLTLGSASIQNVESISFGGDFDYQVTALDTLVAAGARLDVDSYYLPANRSLVFDGSAETDGSFKIVGGLGNDTLIGGAGADELVINRTGDDLLVGNAGADLFRADANLTAADRLVGGTGYDTVLLSNFTAPLTFGAQTLQGIEQITLFYGSDYTLTTHDANVAAGEMMRVEAYFLGAGDDISFNGSAETDGRFQMIGGAGADTFVGGAGRDVFDAHEGSDNHTGGAGDDLFVVRANGGADVITDFVAGAGSDDRINLGAHAAISNLGHVLALASQVGADTRIDFGNGNTLALQNVQMGSLHADDFVFAGQNAAPVITSNGGGATASVTVAENTAAVTTVGAVDANLQTLTYAIAGGADHALFQVDAATGELSFIMPPDWEAPTDMGANNSYVVQVTASDGTLTDTQTITVNVTDVVDAGNSVGSLGDVLWRRDDGRLATAEHDLGPVPNSWRLAGTGDFDADGDADILWHNGGGMVVSWEMENGVYVVNHNHAMVSNSWQVAGTGDFDGDGDDDVLWRSDAGAVVTWEMEDGNYVVNHNHPLVNNSWQVAGTGDFDGDGDADILWRNGASVVTWEMENGAYVVNHNLPAVGNSWSIAATGDLDADGDTDILWRHDAGQVVTWTMENGAHVATRSLGSVATAWEIEGAHDFDHDGDADILWRHDNGQVLTWEMQQGTFAASHDYGIVANVWHMKAMGEFDI